jgi:hypothetical protein
LPPNIVARAAAWVRLGFSIHDWKKANRPSGELLGHDSTAVVEASNMQNHDQNKYNFEMQYYRVT